MACAPEIADDLAAQVADEFGIGVEVSSPGVQLYLEREHLAADWEQKLEEILESFRRLPDAGSLACSHSSFAEEDWAERWKVHFKPLRVGRNFIVAPTWEEVDAGPGDRVIWMNPGRAFGTGHHESTRLCLEWIEKSGTAHMNARRGAGAGLPPAAPRSLLDVGTGSGILVIGAVLVGFEPVVGVDVDPEAIEVAVEDVELNKMAAKVRLMVGSASDVADRFDVVIANIQAFPLVDMAPVLRGRLKETGTLVLSGILTIQKEMVESAYAGENLGLVDTQIDGEWCLLVFER